MNAANANASSDSLQQWNEALLLHTFSHHDDITVQTHRYDGPYGQATLVYCDAMTDVAQISENVLPILRDVLEHQDDLAVIRQQVQARLRLNTLMSDQQLFSQLFVGELIVVIEGTDLVYAINVCNLPKRTPEESATEISIKGPRDGFTEEASTNITLIRRRLRTQQLYNEQFVLGETSQTVVCLLYLNDVVNIRLVEEVRERLKRYDKEALLSSAQLETILADDPYSLFPLTDYIGRPDYAVQALLRGRVILFVNGSPMALIAPTTLTQQLKSPEDLHFPYYFVSFERIMRLSGLIISIFLPGFWIALSAYNMEQLPFQLLATITNSRLGLPMSAPLEMLLMLALFELFREAGTRLPRAVGQTVAVVGGLIVGDAAIRAGLSSPTMLVISAVTAVATFTLVNQSLSGSVSVLRLFSLITSSVLGMFGFFLGMFAILIYASQLKSFGIGYLEPLSPVSWKDVPKVVFSLPAILRNRNSPMLQKQPLDLQRDGDTE